MSNEDGWFFVSEPRRFPLIQERLEMKDSIEIFYDNEYKAHIAVIRHDGTPIAGTIGLTLEMLLDGLESDLSYKSEKTENEF